jgi:hypothetical protein
MRIALRQTLLRSLFCVVGSMILLGVAPVAAAEAVVDNLTAGDLVILRDEARSYEHGEGVAKDLLRAASLYCDGARYGDPEAQFSLGWMYANGRGVQRSDGMAAYFFKLAADQGHDQAMKMLRFVGETAAPMPECMKVVVAEVEPEDTYSPTSPLQKKVFGLVSKLAPEYGVSPKLVMAVIRAESNFEPAAVSPKNAQGLMQLVPETSVRFNVKKPFDPEQNIRGGLSYLRWLLAYFEGNVTLVAAAYNAGEGAVNRYHGIPPYAETRSYVKRIMEIFNTNVHPYDPAITSPSPELSRIRVAWVQARS